MNSQRKRPRARSQMQELLSHGVWGQQVDAFWFTSLEALRAVSFWGLMVASLCRRDCLNHWPLVTRSTSSSSSLSRGHGEGLKVPTLWSNKSNLMVGFPGTPRPHPCILGDFQEPPH